MKKLNLLLLFSAISVILMLTACRTAPIYNVHNAAIPNSGKSALTMQDIEGAIVRAGSGLGWNMRPIEPGLISATLNLRSHQAVVDITYDLNDYNINYKSSINLKYNGTKIHSNYNGWIHNLSNAIDAQIASAQYK
jgi:hypothetical protein